HVSRLGSRTVMCSCFFVTFENCLPGTAGPYIEVVSGVPARSYQSLTLVNGSKRTRLDSAECQTKKALLDPKVPPAADVEGRRHRYSAATLVAASTASTRAAQYLNSGILPNGSSAGLVRRLAAAST